MSQPFDKQQYISILGTALACAKQGCEYCKDGIKQYKQLIAESKEKSSDCENLIDMLKVCETETHSWEATIDQLENMLSDADI